MVAIPEGFENVIPHLTVSDATAAIALYEAALGARNMGAFSFPGSDRIAHAAIAIGPSKVFINDEMPGMGRPAPGPGEGAVFYLYVEDVDAAHARALGAGMSEKSPPEDMFWGDRTSVVTDPFGQTWTLATHIADPTMEEMTEAMKAFGG